MWYSFSLELSFRWDSVNARKRGLLLLQSDVKIGIFATRPVSERRPPMFAKMKDDGEWVSGRGLLFGTGGGAGLGSFWSLGGGGGLGFGTGRVGLTSCGGVDHWGIGGWP